MKAPLVLMKHHAKVNNRNGLSDNIMEANIRTYSSKETEECGTNCNFFRAQITFNLEM